MEIYIKINEKKKEGKKKRYENDQLLRRTSSQCIKK